MSKPVPGGSLLIFMVMMGVVYLLASLLRLIVAGSARIDWLHFLCFEVAIVLFSVAYGMLLRFDRKRAGTRKA